ncbi:MAG: hypothetical protein M3Q71_00410 [Chloroflexota bacterium]|nr:hypothetical protein [Chloroflexota bacterium]
MSVPTRVLFVCDGAAVPSRFAARGWPEKQIRSRGAGADLELHLQGLGSVLRKQVGPRSADLVRIASYAHRADTMVSRGGERDAHGSKWKREFALCVPVADVDHWNGASIRTRLEEALGFATGDTWEFAFGQGVEEITQLPLDVQEQEVMGQPEVVTLLSGGVDSLCALLEAAANGKRPVAVGHWSSENHATRQTDLLEAATRAVGTWNFPRVGFRIHRRGAAWADNSQRSRAFLFASLGAAVAGELGVGSVHLPDNGPISLNLPINDQLVGALASRSTHPKFLYLFNEVIAGLFPTPVVVSNPLVTRTRTEAMGVLKTTRCQHLLPMTLSCSSWQRLPAKTPHCGVCSQCVDRRFAAVAAGLEAHDPADRYRRDVFVDDLDRWQARTTAESYVRFAQRVLPLDNDELFKGFPQIRDVVVPGAGDPEETVRAALDVVKRHAATVLGVLKEMTRRHVDEIVEGNLPPSCLLRLVPAGKDDQVDRTPDLDPSGPGGRDPMVNGAGPLRAQESGTTAENMFAFTGELWTASYVGVTKHLKWNRGYTRIAYLLAHPRREFTALEIIAATEPQHGPVVSEEELEQAGLRPEQYAGGGTLLTGAARRIYEEHVRDLLEDLDEARDQENREREAQLHEQIRQVKDQLDSGIGLGGTAEGLCRQPLPKPGRRLPLDPPGHPQDQADPPGSWPPSGPLHPPWHHLFIPPGI